MPLAQQTTTDANDDIFEGVRDFFESDVWLVVRNVAIFFAVAFWLASAYWVYKDARRRIEDPWLIAVAVALGIFPPFFGPLIYLFFRPPEYLEDVRERQLEIRAMEDALHGGERCPVCRAAVDPGFLVCPICTTRLRQACRQCRQPLDPAWQVCPYCETPVEQPPPRQLVEDDLWTEVRPPRRKSE
jgi:RNA polymerase subunit RPABC4/transcription elongation factor Spt4